MHPYSDTQAFERLLLLIATFLKYPGVGCRDTMAPNHKHHDALVEVQLRLQELAVELEIQFPHGYPTIPTLRKDLETLRKYGILERRIYRWGYYLGTGAMSSQEFKVALDALFTQAKFQGDPQIRRIYDTLNRRLRGLDIESKGELFYPVRQHLNRVIVYTDPEEMASLGKNRDNLFHQLSVVEKAISLGQNIEIIRSSDPYKNNRIGAIQIYPLQLIYHDIAWYLLYEYSQENLAGHLAIGRVNRFADYCKIIDTSGRDAEAQNASLSKAYRLLENGWGLKLGEAEEQRLELLGKLKLITVQVRFYPPVTSFILEGERRHPKQKIIKGAKDKATGELSYIDYILPLPKRSFDEFLLWVNKYMSSAQVISPPELVQKHLSNVEALKMRYSGNGFERM
ncbi:MAG: WYL domain-containing protein [Calothrix sp. C42_A2020_038]|nr:WYL domain-containing protein [Calothrix sp. C42_A2020_038]